MSGSFLRGALVLALAGFFVKLLGAVYRIPFTRLVGSEGIGLYQMAYPIYAGLLALATAGFPVAVSLLVAERVTCGDRAGARRVFLVSLFFLSAAGLVLSLLLVGIAPWLAACLLGERRATLPLVAVAPALFLVAAASAFRGYFQGWQVMWPTALSEVGEPVVRVATGFWAASRVGPLGVGGAVAGATFGACTGGAAGLAFLLAVFWFWERGSSPRERTWSFFPPPAPSRALTVRLLSSALPISASYLVMPLAQALDALVIPKRLQGIGYAPEAATAAFGELSGMAGTLVYLPAIFTSSLASSLAPSLAALAAHGGDGARGRLEAAVRFTVILCFPASLGLAVLATPLTTLIFASPGAGRITAWLAPAAFFAGLQQVTTGALQGLGSPWRPVGNLFAGCLVKLCCNYFLVGIPLLGVRGAAVGSILGFLVAAFLNFRELRLLVGYRGPAFFLPRPILAATIMAAALEPLRGLALGFGEAAATLVAVGGGFSVYFALLLLMGEVRWTEVWRLLRRS